MEKRIHRRDLLAGISHTGIIGLLNIDKAKLAIEEGSFSSRDITGLAADTQYLYILANADSGKYVSVISLSNNEEVRRLTPPNNGSALAGLAIIGSELWFVDFYDREIFTLNLDTGQTEQAFSVSFDPAGIGYDGQSLWIGNISGNYVHQFTRSGEEVSQFSVSGYTYTPAGVACYDDYIWVGDKSGARSSAHIYQFDRDGNLVNSTEQPSDMTGVGANDDGVLIPSSDESVKYLSGFESSNRVTETLTQTPPQSPIDNQETEVASSDNISPTTPTPTETPTSSLPGNFTGPIIWLLLVVFGGYAVYGSHGILSSSRERTAESNQEPPGDNNEARSEDSITNQTIVVSDENARVEKSFDADGPAGASIKFQITANSDNPVHTQVIDRVPPTHPMEEIGVYPQYEGDNLIGIGSQRIKYERTLDPNESTTAIYGIEIEDLNEAADFLTEPTLSTTSPPEEEKKKPPVGRITTDDTSDTTGPRVVEVDSKYLYNDN